MRTEFRKCESVHFKCTNSVLWFSLLRNIITPSQHPKLTVDDIEESGAHGAPGHLEKQTWRAEHDSPQSVQPQSLEPLNASTLHPLSCHSFLYLGPQLLFCFTLRDFRSLIYILCTFFFFLKLPKILHKGKLCSLFYALSDEAKYPLIVDQRRRKNLEAINEFQAIANLRKRTAPSSQKKFRRPSR